MRRALRARRASAAAWWLLGGGGAGVVILAIGLLDPRAAHSESAPEVRPEVLHAVRLLLSEDPKDEARGEQLIRKMGAGAVPDLRVWVHGVRLDLDRVASLLADLEGEGGLAPSSEHVTAGELFSKKIAECRALVRQGDYRGGLALAEAILLLDRHNPYSWELRRLVRRAKERLVTTQVLEPSVEASKLVYEVGERPDLLFRVRNHDARVARIRLDRGVLGELSVTVTRQFMDGSLKRDESRVLVQVSEDVDQVLVGPGLAWENPLAIVGLEDLPQEGVVARVQVAGRFRPRRWTMEREDTENIGLPMSPAEFWIVPKGEGDLCDRPLEKLTAGLFFKDLETLFVGGQIAVWAAEEDAYYNEHLVKTLVESLDELDPVGQKLADRFLSQATGRRPANDPAAWKEWWRKRAAESSPPKADPAASRDR